MSISRRAFLRISGAGVAASSLVATSFDAGPPANDLIIQDVIDLLIESAAGGPEQTVDTIKIGDASRPLAGVVTTMFATLPVIRRTAELGANFIIAHEPTFYNHLDESDWLGEDDVFQSKRRLIDRHGIVLWRFHDYLHRFRPDGILQGVLEQLEWRALCGDDDVCTIPEISLRDLTAYVKRRLSLQAPRVVGDPAMVVRRVGMLPGAWGGRRQIEMLGRAGVDAIICGEVNEWEAAEYARDARDQGRPKALIVTGHVASEEPGMRWLADWLRPQVRGITVTHLPSGDPFWIG